MSLQARLPIRHLLKHPLQAALCIVGIALGIAVVLAIDITNESARKAFKTSSAAVSGGSTHSILGGGRGIDETIYTKLRVDHGIRGLRPVVSGYVTVADSRFMLIGIDPFAESANRWTPVGNDAVSLPLLSKADAVLLLSSTARMLGLDIPSKLDVQIGGVNHSLNIVGTLEPADDLQRHGLRNVLISDISTAQVVLGMLGRLSTIELISADPHRVATAIPESVTLVPSESRSRTMEQMTRAFHLNLTALSLLALIIGAFLIYNTMTLAVLKRREQFAVLRALGMTARQLFGSVILEALVLAMIGFCIGAAAGFWLSKSLLQMVGGTINDLYFAVEVQTVSVTYTSLGKAGALAVFATVAAACLPAWEAMRTTPAFSSVRSNIETGVRKNNALLSIAGLNFGIAAALLLIFSEHSIIAGFGSLFLIIMGFALITPVLMVHMLSVIGPLLNRWMGLLGRMAARGVGASLSRTQVAVTALAIAVSAIVGVSVMISSFRASVDHWLGNFLRADVYLAQPAVHKASGLDPTLIAGIAARPEVDSLSTGRWVTLQERSGPIQLFAVDLERAAFDSYQLVNEENGDIWPAFSGHDTVIISEPFAYRRQLEAGDAIRLPTDSGEKTFSIAGVFYDYGSDQGVVAMHRSTYDRHWNDPVVSSFALYLKDEVDTEDFVDRLNRETLTGRALRIRSNRTIRELSLEIFDRTFTITDVLRLLAISIAVVGILSALTAIQLERAREFAVLRAVGLSPRQLWILVTTESGLMGLIAGIIACPLGLVMAWVLIHIINRRSFGWSMDLAIHPEPWITAIILSIVAAVVAGLYPASKMAGKFTSLSLRYE
jgi:putative ABC transport system permease protein